VSDLLDLYGTSEPPEPMAVHTITVTRVEYEEPAASDVFGIDPIECAYEIDHGECNLRDEECLVQSTITDLGLHAALFGVWDSEHRLEEKSYRVRGWTSTSPATPNGPAEYDAGIEEVDDDESE
jgi:hypothetical protein